jgi:hypothetical protein
MVGDDDIDTWGDGLHDIEILRTSTVPGPGSGYDTYEPVSEGAQDFFDEMVRHAARNVGKQHDSPGGAWHPGVRFHGYPS